MLSYLRNQMVQLKSVSRALSISVLSQGVSSLTNFGIVLYLVRVMSKAQFGQYSIGFATVMLAGAVVCAFIAVQFVVNLPDQPIINRASYALHHAMIIVISGSLLV
ncbi:MAG: hypothetical protein ACYDEX_14650, partial [Mobilitalea sp.]